MHLCNTVFLLFFIALNTFSSNQSNRLQLTSYNFKQEIDSTCLKVVYYNHGLRTRHIYTINVFINKKLYKPDVYVKDGFIYIPDTLKSNDRIKTTSRAERWASQRVKRKSYNFKYSESDNITIKVVYKKGVKFLQRKPLYSPNFY
jgi:hypothetical protein